MVALRRPDRSGAIRRVMVWEPHDAIRQRLDGERGRIDKQGGVAVALAYPSPYHTGMSSLGYQQVYKLIQGSDGFRCARTFLPDDDATQREVSPLTYEDLRPLSHYPIIAFSVAYELELAGVVAMLERSSIPSLRE